MAISPDNYTSITHHYPPTQPLALDLIAGTDSSDAMGGDWKVLEGRRER